LKTIYLVISCNTKPKLNPKAAKFNNKSKQYFNFICDVPGKTSTQIFSEKISREHTGISFTGIPGKSLDFPGKFPVNFRDPGKIPRNPGIAGIFPGIFPGLREELTGILGIYR